MRDLWREVTLGDVLEARDERAGPSGPDRVLSVTEKRGIVGQEEVFRKRIATNDISKYKVLSPLDIAYNPYLLWTGAIGQWRGEGAGVTSPVYECFRVRSANDPRFIGLIIESGRLTSYFDSTAIGSIQRRRRTTPAVFLAAPIRLPPLDEQRRIVDLIAAVDEAIEAAERTTVAAAESWHAAASAVFDQNGPTALLGDIVKVTMGRQRSPKNALGEHMVHYMRAANVKDGRLALDDVLQMNFHPGEQETFRLESGDVLVTEGCGSLKQIGASACWSGELGGTVCFQNTLLRLRAIPGVTCAGYVHHLARYAFAAGWWARISSGTNIFRNHSASGLM